MTMASLSADKLGLRQIRCEDTSNLVNKLNWSSVGKLRP